MIPIRSVFLVLYQQSASMGVMLSSSSAYPLEVLSQSSMWQETPRRGLS